MEPCGYDGLAEEGEGCGLGFRELRQLRTRAACPQGGRNGAEWKGGSCGILAEVRGKGEGRV